MYTYAPRLYMCVMIVRALTCHFNVLKHVQARPMQAYVVYWPIYMDISIRDIYLHLYVYANVHMYPGNVHAYIRLCERVEVDIYIWMSTSIRRMRIDMCLYIYIYIYTIGDLGLARDKALAR